MKSHPITTIKLQNHNHVKNILPRDKNVRLIKIGNFILCQILENGNTWSFLGITSITRGAKFLFGSRALNDEYQSLITGRPTIDILDRPLTRWILGCTRWLARRTILWEGQSDQHPHFPSLREIHPPRLKINETSKIQLHKGVRRHRHKRFCCILHQHRSH